MAPLDHLFDDHHLCDPSWCHKKKKESEKDATVADINNERNSKTYYCSKETDSELYSAMKKKYQHSISEEHLLHCQHSFDTQINKGMNNSVAAYANKGKHYGGTSSLLTHVHIAAGVHLVGYHHFWTSCLKQLEVQIPYQLHMHLLSLDKEKAARFHRDHNFENKRKRKRLEHEKFYKEYIAHQKDVARNDTYESCTGCEATAGVASESSYIPRNYGCEGKNNHKTERSKHCAYHESKRGGLTLEEALNNWSYKKWCRRNA